MMTRIIGTLAASFLLAANANAASMTITGPLEILVGDTFELQILGDFSGEGLIAGGINFLYDPAFAQLDSIVLNLPVVADFSCPGSLNCPAPVPGSAPIVWGEFLNDLIAPDDPAPILMATVTFTAISLGSGSDTVFSMMDNPALTGGWFGAGFVPIPTPSLGEFRLVPLPAAAWLMIGGLACLAGFRKHRSN